MPQLPADSTMRLLAVRHTRRLQHLLPTPRCHEALDTIERYARGEATKAEMCVAETAAYCARTRVARHWPEEHWKGTFAAAHAVVRAAAWNTAWERGTDVTEAVAFLESLVAHILGDSERE